MSASLGMKLFAEFLGTAALMLSILASGGNFLIVGATLGAVMFLLGGISGAPVNPAVSAGLYYSGSLNGTMFTMYSIAEILGGLAATYAYLVVS
jgi:aquaporin Z